MQQLGLSSGISTKNESRLRAILWPELRQAPEIHVAINSGQLACFVVAILAMLDASMFQSGLALIGAIVFAALGFGIGRKARACAVIAFVWYLANRVVVIATMSGEHLGLTIAGLLLTLALTVILLNAMRAAFAYHRLNDREDPNALRSSP
jgi:hypothetical protein